MPSVADQRIDKKAQTIERWLNFAPIRATLGNPATGQIVDPLLPQTNVLVMIPSANGQQLTERSVVLDRKVSLRMVIGEPVKVGYINKRDLGILGPDNLVTAATGQSNAAIAQQAASGSTPALYDETLRLIAIGGMVVSVKSWNVVLNNVYYQFQKPGLDLNSFVPASGNMLYALIAVLADLSDVEVITSTARAVTDLPLGVADVNECIAGMTSGSTPAWCVKLVGDQTTITQDDLDNDAVDLRQRVNAKGIYQFTPASSADTAGATGDFAYDDNYIYVKTAGNGWTRAALSTF